MKEWGRGGGRGGMANSSKGKKKQGDVSRYRCNNESTLVSMQCAAAAGLGEGTKGSLFFLEGVRRGMKYTSRPRC